MKNIFIYLFFLTLLVTGCKKTDGGDIIKLSAKGHTFNAEGGSFTVTTEGTFWWIIECEVDSISYYPICTDESTVNNYDGIAFYCNSFGKQNHFESSKIENDWFSITKENLQKIVFVVLPNETGKVRKIRLHLEAGDYFTFIDISQAAE